MSNGSKIPSEPKEPRVSCRVDRDMIERLERIAKTNGIDVSDVVRMALKRQLPAYEGSAIPMESPKFTLAPYQFVNKERELKVCGLCAREQNVALSDQDREAVSVCPKHVKIELRKVA